MVNALIHAKRHAVSMRCARSSIESQFALVHNVSSQFREHHEMAAIGLFQNVMLTLIAMVEFVKTINANLCVDNRLIAQLENVA